MEEQVDYDEKLKEMRKELKEERESTCYAVLLVYAFSAVFTLAAALERGSLGKKISKLESKLTPNTTNVIGQDPNDASYEINGQKAYLEVDGQPIEKYLERK